MAFASDITQFSLNFASFFISKRTYLTHFYLNKLTLFYHFYLLFVIEKQTWISGKNQFNLRASVGTTGDSYDNALAETVNGLYKKAVIKYLKANWQGLGDVQLATLNLVD